MDALARLCEYVISDSKSGIDPGSLPGALLGREPEDLWDTFAKCQRFDFYLGTRVSPQWPRANYVMATDSHLQSVLVSHITRLEAERSGRSQPIEKPGGERIIRYPNFHLVQAPGRDCNADNPGDKWAEMCREALDLYHRPLSEKPNATIALGSMKVNPMVELVLAHAFRAEPFVSQDAITYAKDRSCPFFFRYRDSDPQPPSMFGGLQLSSRLPAPQPGLYYESDCNHWECCPWDPDTSDAAFVFYAYRPNLAQFEVACGGFSSRATACLSQKLDRITAEFGGPQYDAGDLRVGLYIIQFRFDPRDADSDQDNRVFETRVVRVPDRAVVRRLRAAKRGRVKV
jgi:hypothetical protein